MFRYWVGRGDSIEHPLMVLSKSNNKLVAGQNQQKMYFEKIVLRRKTNFRETSVSIGLGYPFVNPYF